MDGWTDGRTPAPLFQASSPPISPSTFSYIFLRYPTLSYIVLYCPPLSTWKTPIFPCISPPTLHCPILSSLGNLERRDFPSYIPPYVVLHCPLLSSAVNLERPDFPLYISSFIVLHFPILSTLKNAVFPQLRHGVANNDNFSALSPPTSPIPKLSYIVLCCPTLSYAVC